MPDISMCPGQARNPDGQLPNIFICPIKSTCYRFTAQPSGYQTYFVLPPMSGGKDCEFFMDNKEWKK